MQFKIKFSGVFPRDNSAKISVVFCLLGHRAAAAAEASSKFSRVSSIDLDTRESMFGYTKMSLFSVFTLSTAVCPWPYF